MKSWRTLLFAAVWIVGSVANATLDAEVDTSSLVTADTLRLTLRADGTNLMSDPNFDPLRADFDVLSTQRSSQFRSINGRVDAWTTWSLLLKPKHTGTLQIPALRLGSEQSQPIQITVKELDPEQRHAIDEIVFFETTRTPLRTYVQAQLVVSRKLFYASDAQLYGEMPDIPEIPGAMVRPLGDAQHSTSVRNGRQYGVIEQNFAVFPERSGTLAIPQATVTGSLRLPGNGGRRIGVDIRSEALSVDVLPIPPEYPPNAPWLPATQVELLEDWPGVPEHGVAVGESSQRTLIVRVDGNAASAIPPLVTSLPSAFKAYPEPPALNEIQTAVGVVGTRTETTSLVATEPGAVTLPEVHVTWWDTINHQVKTASLTAHTIDVTGAALPRVGENAHETTTAPIEQRQIQTPTAQAADVPAQDTLTTSTAGSTWSRLRNMRASNVWLVVFATILLVGSGATVWRTRRRLRPAHPRAPKNLEAVTYRTFLRACESGDPQHIRSAFDAWLQTHYPMALNHAAAQFMRDPNARNAVNALNARLYRRNHDQTFDSTTLRECVDSSRRQVTSRRHTGELPALYPST